MLVEQVGNPHRQVIQLGPLRPKAVRMCAGVGMPMHHQEHSAHLAAGGDGGGMWSGPFPHGSAQPPAASYAG